MYHYGNKFLWVFVFFALCCGLPAQEYYVNGISGDDGAVGNSPASAWKTAEKGMGVALNTGGVLHLENLVCSKIKVKEKHYTQEKPLVIDGHNSTLIYGFDGLYNKEKNEWLDRDGWKPFNPPTSMPSRTWGGLSLQDCSWVVVKNLMVWGGNQNTIEMTSSYPEHGLHHVGLINIVQRYGQTRGLFFGGTNMHHIGIVGCTFMETMYDGGATHNCYLSGGVWDKSYPPIHDIYIIDSTFCYTRGRHGLQINGRFKNVFIHGCNFFHNQLNGFSGIGIQGLEMERCQFWGNGRGAIVCYNDFDSSYWDASNPESVNEWTDTHHPNGDWVIKNCSMLNGDKPWASDFWHNNDPSQFPVILINNSVDGMVCAGYPGGLDFPTGKITLKDNILAGYKQTISFYSVDDALQTTVDGNICWNMEEGAYITVPADIDIGYGNNVFPFKWLNENITRLYRKNLVTDPKFPQRTWETIDLTDDNYNWGAHYKDAIIYKLTSKKGKWLGKGATALRPVAEDVGFPAIFREN